MTTTSTVIASSTYDTFSMPRRGWRRVKLTAKHLPGDFVKLVCGQLSCDMQIDHGDREEAAFEEETLALLARFEKRPPSRCFLVQNIAMATAIVQAASAAQLENAPDEAMDTSTGFDASAPWHWSIWDIDEEMHSEGQQALMACQAGDVVVGYAILDFRLHCWPKERDYTFMVTCHLVYVNPQHRGAGYGFDLSVACSRVAADLLEASYRAVPSGCTLDSSVVGDLCSDGGEAFMSYLADELGFRRDCLADTRQRPSIKVGQVRREFGW
jgi:GNAT superfamily N-acetyltransferase